MLGSTPGQGIAPYRPGRSWGGVMSNRKARRRAAAARRTAKPITEAERRQMISRGIWLLAAIVAGALLLGWAVVNAN